MIIVREGDTQGEFPFPQASNEAESPPTSKRSVKHMVKVIMGVKGTGKTKQLIELVNQAIAEDKGDVVVIEKDQKLTYDIPYKARLIFANQFFFDSFTYLKGFISGLHAGNYDITHVFIDSLYKIVGTEDGVEDFLAWLDDYGKSAGIEFTITISADVALATDGIKKFF